MEEKTILLIEDNPMDVDLTLRAFKRRNLTNPVEVLRDGQEALDLMALWTPESVVPMIILLDVNLPKVGGLEVLRQLRAHSLFGTIPVVMLTTSAEAMDIQTAYKFGANSYIVKPVDFDKFVAVVEQIERYWMALNQSPRVPL